MQESADDSWADGISELVRELLAGGATDAAVDQFIRARQDGDEELAQHLLLAATQTAIDGGWPDSRYENFSAVRRLQIAALRPVVNGMSALELFRYVHFIQCVTARMVETHSGEAFWSSYSAVDAAGKSLARPPASE